MKIRGVKGPISSGTIYLDNGLGQQIIKNIIMYYVLRIVYMSISRKL
jgi:hypothetical protein